MLAARLGAFTAADRFFKRLWAADKKQAKKRNGPYGSLFKHEYRQESLCRCASP